MTPGVWRCRDRVFDLAERTRVMGVLNVTPDSFSDGGRYLDPADAIAHGRRMLQDGADLLDLGAESTRPGAAPVPATEQLRRLMPVVDEMVRAGACVSVDTTRAEVALTALAAGAHVVNDVSALGDPGMGQVVAAAGAGLVLMHMQGTPATMQQAPRYDDVAREVRDFLAARLAAAAMAGIAAEYVAIDPGIGFGKTLDDNLRLIARLDELVALGRPVLLGVSRKSFLGRVLDGAATDERLEAGLAVAAIGAFAGAGIIRTHDVAATVRALRAADAIAGAQRIAANA